MAMPGFQVTEGFFPTDAEIDQVYLDMGYAQHQLAVMRADYHERMNNLLALTQGQIPVIGVRMFNPYYKIHEL